MPCHTKLHSSHAWLPRPRPPPSQGARVRFLFMAMGSEEGLHGPRVEGTTLLSASGPVSSVMVLPALVQVRAPERGERVGVRGRGE